MRSTTHHAMFEALFDRRLEPGGDFATELADAGSDAPVAEPVGRRGLPRDRPGVHAGFLETFVGRVVSAALPFRSPASFLDRLATSFRMGREDFGLLFDVVESSEGSARAVVHNPSAVPGAFVAALIEIAHERLGRRGRVEVHQTSATDDQLLVRWDVTSPR